MRRRFAISLRRARSRSRGPARAASRAASGARSGSRRRCGARRSRSSRPGVRRRRAARARRTATSSMWLSPRLSASTTRCDDVDEQHLAPGRREHLRERDADVAGVRRWRRPRSSRGSDAVRGGLPCCSIMTEESVESRSAIRCGGLTVSVQLRPFVRHRRLGHRRARAAGSSSTSRFAPTLDRVHPLRARPQRDARDAVPVRLLLEAAGVGDDHARLRRRAPRSRGSRAAGASRARCSWSVRPSRSRAALCAGGPGRRQARSARSAPPTMRAQPLRARVRLAVHGRDDVAAGRQLELRQDRDRAGRSARAASSRRPSRHRRPRSRPGDAFARRASARERSSGANSTLARRSTSIRLRSSGIERSPLRRPASTCATGTAASTAAMRAGERRVRVAVDEHRVRPRLREPRRGSAASSPSTVGGVEVEPNVGLGQARAPRRRPPRARGRSAGPCAGAPRRSPGSRSATESGADLTN